MGGHLLRPIEAQMLTEYRALEAFGWTHAEYVATPSYIVSWLLSIRAIENAIEKEQTEQARRKAAAGG